MVYSCFMQKIIPGTFLRTEIVSRRGAQKRRVSLWVLYVVIEITNYLNNPAIEWHLQIK
jgi:hypothetical protein